MYKVDGKYYVTQYRPGWPSKIYDSFIKNELRRMAFPLTITEKLSFVFLAITRKCPMQCEHCFEWDNLNLKESFTKEDGTIRSKWNAVETPMTFTHEIFEKWL